MEDIRREAAKDLEPKLLAVTEENTLAVRDLREIVKSEVDTFQLELQRTNELKLAKLKSELASTLQQETNRASLDHDTRMEDMRAAYQLEITQVR